MERDASRRRGVQEAFRLETVQGLGKQMIQNTGCTRFSRRVPVALHARERSKRGHGATRCRVPYNSTKYKRAARGGKVRASIEAAALSTSTSMFMSTSPPGEPNLVRKRNAKQASTRQIISRGSSMRRHNSSLQLTALEDCDNTLLAPLLQRCRLPHVLGLRSAAARTITCINTLQVSPKNQLDRPCLLPSARDATHGAYAGHDGRSHASGIPVWDIDEFVVLELRDHAPGNPGSRDAQGPPLM
ncbi:hypothetical protein BKA67DRAFT_534055 [Truncatella angustata]|uniref:Uncharacterized protein n=1 Tax=Truncatella angustata TaxID=152316 RepID=A0A9P8ZXN9_9PEZI|nr:uncharacterized protein BKA67DRAFT_534055 [Truncatella angustata]KAH6655116.1 hypothetical protein BKA67DRAFT_534055 [Truncatella angustata]